MRPSRFSNFWRYLWPVLPPILLCGLVAVILRQPLAWWLHGEEKLDQETMVEWMREARPGELKSLPELVREYLEHVHTFRELDREAKRAQAQGGEAAVLNERLRIAEGQVKSKESELHDQLKALGNPPTRMFRGQLPLFPVIFRLTVEFGDGLAPISWDSDLPRQPGQYRTLTGPLLDGEDVTATVEYNLHAYTQRQARERQEVARRLWLSGLGAFAAVLALVWIYVAQRRARDRQRQKAIAEQQVGEAERRRLEEELRRQEAERQKEEVERQALELKSQLFANIGIMAGSYAHNIKNLLVRPNDLLRRCLDDNPPGSDRMHMLQEVRHTLGTVTERLQQILKTVNRDPTQSERVRVDLNALVADIHRTWSDLARERWKMSLELDLGPLDDRGRPMPLWIEGDPSHLQQVLENLLTNARDATFEMRNHLRDQARRPSVRSARVSDPADATARSARVSDHADATTAGLPKRPETAPTDGQETFGRSEGGVGDPRPALERPAQADAERRQALIAAAAWRGEVTLRTRAEGDRAILEVRDNGIGMSDEVRRRCVETHFSTKRNNALFAGLSAGMGLGLSFVTVILSHHRATLEIDSEPMQGATFRALFPRVG